MNGIKIILLLSQLLAPSLVKAEELSLTSFLQKVKEQNLDLKVEAEKFAALDAKSIGIAIPAPMVAITQMKEDGGHLANGFEVDQTIPFPTKLWGDSAARKRAAQSQNESRLGRENEIMADAKLLYFSLWSATEKLTLLEEKKEILQEHINLSRSSARSDSFASIHLLKAESDFDLLENDIATTEQNVREQQAAVATLLNVESANFHPSVIEPPLSSIPSTKDTSHQVQSMQLAVESFHSRELEAKSAWLPDFNLRYNELGATSMAGRYRQITVGITVPFLFFWEPNSMASEASSQSSQAELELEKQNRTITAEKSTLLSRAESLKKQLEMLTGKLIPRAEKRMKLAHNLAPRDMETLQDHREAMEAFPDLKMKALDLRLEYEKTIASLEKYAVNE